MTATKTKTEDVRKVVHTAVDQFRTSLLAALGAGNLASQAVADAMAKAKERVTETSEAARKNIEELPTEVESFREKLDPVELDKIVAQPQVKKALGQFEEALQTAQGRVEEVASETRERVDVVLAKVTKKTRSTGEKAARKVKSVADETAEQVEEIGDELARETRSVSRKVASKTAPRAASTTRRTTTSAAVKKPATPKASSNEK
jgi:heparin binding hemagglutinin HbhA